MATEDARKLFMAGLPDSVTEETLRALFVETGARVEDLSLPKDRATGRPKGYAFVRLGSEQDTERARQELDGRIVDGKMISVRPFLPEPPGGRGAPRGEGGGGGGDRPGGYGGAAGAGGAGGDRPGGYGGGGGERRGGGAQNAPDRTLYVGNLPYDASQEEVEAMFKEAGATDVVRVYLPVDQDGRKRGFGFVTMASAEAAQGAIEVLRDAALRNRRLMINIAHPPNKSGDRPPRPEGGFSRPMGGAPGGFSGGGGYSGGGGGGGGGGYSSGGPPGTGGPPGAGRRPDQKKKSFDDGGGPRRGQKGRRDEVWRDRDDDDE